MPVLTRHDALWEGGRESATQSQVDATCGEVNAPSRRLRRSGTGEIRAGFEYMRPHTVVLADAIVVENHDLEVPGFRDIGNFEGVVLPRPRGVVAIAHDG
jgi:hypothetical protein